MERAQLVAWNNAEWCAAVWQVHDLGKEEADGSWFTRKATPSLYPNMVTVECFGKQDRQISIAISLSMQLTKVAVKDSFSVLPLHCHGYNELFTAQWLWADLDIFARGGICPSCRMVVGKGDMLEWIAAWEEAGGESANLLPAVLTNPQVEVWGRYGKSGQLEGGLIAFRSPRVVGITNEFGSNEGLLEAVAAEGGQPICCYQRGERLARAIQRGFEVVGPLTVWLLDRS